MTVKKVVAPWVRIGIMLLATCVIAILAYYFTGSVLPHDPKEALIFQNALLLVVLGSALLEHHYTKPADSLVNSLMGLITLLSVYSQAPKLPWAFIAVYCAMVLLLSTTCVAVSASASISGWQDKLSNLTYHPAVVFGRARFLFSLVFLSGLWFFYSVQEPITLALVLFWGLFISLWPLKIPILITSWFERSKPGDNLIGKITRFDSPNLLRVALSGDYGWTYDQPKACSLPNGKSQWVLPLYAQFQEDRQLATGLLTSIEYKGKAYFENSVFEPDPEIVTPNETEINKSLGGGEDASLIGFVVEGSSVSTIRFETLNSVDCEDGMLVWSQVAGRKVYYQIVSGETNEESFASDKHGFQVASAAQLGKLNENSGFKKHEWLPAMNAPVFSSKENSNIEISAVKEGDFKLGVIPKSKIDIGGSFATDYNHHTALLGVTGSGKTELAFDLIRHALDDGIKVVCIDLTAQYEGRLSDLNPVDLSIDEETSNNLSQKLFDVETGQYGAGNEKKALSEFAEQLNSDVATSVENFMDDDQGSGLGLIRLEEISNTKATLWITELYMTCLLKYARENLDNKPRVLIVVEEAHTVMPEPNAMGLGDYDSKGLVGKIAQIALQGRKYGVGLLVLAQRTATVSKTVLTQCNTIISFTAYDQTSLEFLQNIYGKEYVSLIPNLPSLHAIAFGKWIRSEKPIVFKVPFDDKKSNLNP